MFDELWNCHHNETAVLLAGWNHINGAEGKKIGRRGAFL
jgi:hypothetical protein